MSLRKLTAGDGYTYLTRQVAAHDATEKGRSSLADYYDEKGESPGRWMGSGLAALELVTGETVTAAQMAALFGLGHHPRSSEIEASMAARGCTATEIAKAVALGRQFSIKAAASPFNRQVAEAFTAYNLSRGQRWNSPIRPEERARIRTEIGNSMFVDVHGRQCQDARELSGFIAKASRQATTAIAGYDLSFSPVKSVSALWAIAPPHVADEVRAAHEAAVAHTVRWLEGEAVYTRVGRAGARQVKARGLAAATFTHRDSRAGDPDLHTHVAISNKVQTEDGRWLALDGRLLYAAKVAASEHYNTRLEAELRERLGVEFVERDSGRNGKRPVREIRGFSTTLTRYWSRRRADIESRQAELASEFQKTFGRPPSAVEAIWQGDQATLETRAPKHEPRSERVQRDTWRAEADDVMGDPAEVDEMCARAVARTPSAATLTREWVEAAASCAVEVIEASRATWNVWHLTAEAQRQTRKAGIPLLSVEHAVAQVVEVAISHSIRLGVLDPIADPPPLCRADGQSVYDVHGATLYTSSRVLRAEEEVLTLACCTGAHALSETRVEAALGSSAAQGLELNDAQATMVRDLATSGAAVQLALAPAGTGKTAAMGVLADAWEGSGGRVIGLAPSAQAAHELGQAISGHCDTLAKLTWSLAHEGTAEWPRWIRDVGPQTLVIIDEAGQAATTELATAIRFVADRGGAVRLVGDDQQLASVGAGGLLRDLQREVGASTLSEVRRFDDPAEAAATLAVREGDSAALGFYADNARVHVGDLGIAADQAYEAWSADRSEGLDAVLLAPTRELVSRLNRRARSDRLGRTAGTPVEVDLSDGNCASARDIVVTRRNSRRLMISRSNWVKNGDRWVVDGVHADGSLVVRHLELGRSVVLPADYVAEHVQLGYATTVHGAQGMTADTAHLVATGEETRQTLYVGISRGRTSNHLYLATGCDGDPHGLIDPKALRPPTALDVLSEVLERDGSHRSATTATRDASSYVTQLHEAALRYHDAVTFAAEQVLGPQRVEEMERNIEVLWPGLTSEAAYPTLRARLCLRALGGDDPIALLLDAGATREMATSEERSAVLDWRLGEVETTLAGPLPWLEPVPDGLLDQPMWGPYLAARARRVERLDEAVRAEAGAWTAAQAPAWAGGLTSDALRDLRTDLAVWRAAFAVADDDRRSTGARQQGRRAATYQEVLDRRVRAVISRSRAAVELMDMLPDCVRRDAACDRLAERLGALQAAQVDVLALVQEALGVTRPLPDERPADALWWRIVRHLGPAALQATAGQAHTLRPLWTSYLCARVGSEAGERVMADAMWPALVAAIRARPSEWTAEQLIDAVTSGARTEVRAEDLCSALVWRVATMTDAPFAQGDPLERDLEPTPDGPLAAAPPAKLGVGRDRILELNRWALDHYCSMFSRSWAPAYLIERLGTDLSDTTQFHAGYAPPGPASLIRRLGERGATIAELIEAGLARETARGQVVDVFRDRLVFPIYAGSDLVGFIGRRNPTKPDSELAGPKYLNTRTTPAFSKGRQLFGLPECADELAAGGTPVLVEGPMDAIAVTIATDGEYVGLAPLGTALTDSQALLLDPHFADDPAGIVLATDPDAAGWQAGCRAFWTLTAMRAEPRHLELPDGIDPADLMRTAGAVALRDRLTQSSDFASDLVDGLLAQRLSDDQGAFARVDLARDLAFIVGALAPERWPQHAQHLADRLDLPLEVVCSEIYEAGALWTDNPQACAARALARQHSVAPTTALPRAGEAPTHTAPQLMPDSVTHRRHTTDLQAPGGPA